jgi:hypothetical protein
MYNAGTEMQYTIRNIPKKLDNALRKRAKEQRKSLNQVAVEALATGLGLANGDAPIKYRDLSDWVGRWVEDPAFEEAREFHERIDPDLWK